MKVHFKQSIKQQLDELFGKGTAMDISYVELTEYEYIQLLEEIGPLGQILIVDVDTKFRHYKGIRLKVLR